MFQFGPGETKPSLTLGQRLEPGPGKHQLCMPTDVAVAATGEVFVSDGYCNSRVLKFDPAGSLLRTYPEGRGESHVPAAPHCTEGVMLRLKSFQYFCRHSHPLVNFLLVAIKQFVHC